MVATAPAKTAHRLAPIPPPRGSRAANWEHEWWRQIVEQARRLALGLGMEDPPSVLTYATGAVTGPNEHVYAETWVRCNIGQGNRPSSDWPLVAWAVTSERLLGRGPGGLVSLPWATLSAYQADVLSERVDLHVGDWVIVFCGPGASIVAVAAAWHVHGLAGLLEHPGLAPLRARLRR